MTLRVFLLPVLMFLIPGTINTISGQQFKNIRQAEDTLSALLVSLNLSRNDSAREIIDQAFSDNLYEALKLPSSDNYPFESLKTLVKITSPDNKFRIFHWNLPAGDGKHRYHGFIKMLSHDPPLIFPLVDMSDSLTSPDTDTLNNLHWFGALYYKVIPGVTASGSTIYTLLGWAGKNSTITQKVIEILSFDDLEHPHFGLPLFPDYPGGTMTRIIFRFAATTTMSLKYEKQTIASGKKWNSKKREFEYTLNETEMIVGDRLVPLDPQLEGQYQFYVPSGGIYDGFVFEHNHWKYMPGVDIRNKKQ